MTTTAQIPMRSIRMPKAKMPAFTQVMPLVVSLRPNWQLRTLLLRVLGAALVLSSTGLWLLPGADYDPDLALFKIGISVAFLFAGLVLMLVNDPDAQPDVCFDPIRRELRILQNSAA